MSGRQQQFGHRPPDPRGIRLTHRVIPLGLRRVHEPKEYQSDRAHRDKEDESHVGIAIRGFDNSGRDEWANETRGSAYGVEESEE
jgi:hypothetical protein